jgi:Na+/H+-dicarboxylate symporter
MTVIPLVVSLLITGVASASDIKAVGRLGGRTLVVFVLLLAGTAALIVPLAPVLFSVLPAAQERAPLPPGAAEAAGSLGGAGQTFTVWLTTLVPANPIAAAASDAMLPLIIFTLVFALAVAQLRAAHREPLVDFFRALGDAMLVIVRWVILAAPAGVFALALPLAARAGSSFVGAIGFYIVAYSVACVLVTLLLYPVVAIAARIPIAQFARAALPAQLIAISSSSSIASLPALNHSAEHRLRLPPDVTGFVLPLSVSAFKIAAPVSWSIGALFVAHFYGIPIGARELAVIAFGAVLFGLAIPGVPRGAFITLAPLFTAIGLPLEGIGILIAVDVIPDVLATALNVTGALAATTIVAPHREAELART